MLKAIGKKIFAILRLKFVFIQKSLYLAFNRQFDETNRGTQKHYLLNLLSSCHRNPGYAVHLTFLIIVFDQNSRMVNIKMHIFSAYHPILSDYF